MEDIGHLMECAGHVMGYVETVMSGGDFNFEEEWVDQGDYSEENIAKVTAVCSIFF